MGLWCGGWEGSDDVDERGLVMEARSGDELREGGGDEVGELEVEMSGKDGPDEWLVCGEVDEVECGLVGGLLFASLFGVGVEPVRGGAAEVGAGFLADVAHMAGEVFGVDGCVHEEDGGQSALELGLEEVEVRGREAVVAVVEGDEIEAADLT